MEPKWALSLKCGSKCSAPFSCFEPAAYEAPGLELCVPPGFDPNGMMERLCAEPAAIFAGIIWLIASSALAGLLLALFITWLWRRRGRTRDVPFRAAGPGRRTIRRLAALLRRNADPGRHF